MTEDEPIELIDDEFDDLATAKIMPPAWVVEDLLPAGITFLAAPPKAGKSTLTVAMACMVAAYKCNALPGFLRTVPSTGPVFMFSAEAMAGEIRFIAERGLGIQLIPNESILVAKKPEDFRIDEPSGLAKMLYWLEARHPRLVILDPLRNFHAEDENDSGVMIRMLAPLRRWAVHHKASFVVVHHTNKPKEGQQNFSAQDMRGSSALFGIADGVLVATPRGRSNEVHIDATFKRAKGWERTLQIAAYDDLNRPPAEVLTAIDKQIMSALARGECLTVGGLALEMKQTPEKIRDSLLKLVRNGLADNDGDDFVPRIQQ